MHMPIQFLAKVNVCRTDILHELYDICGPALQLFAHASFHLIQIALYDTMHLLQILAAFAAGDKLLKSSKLTGCRSSRSGTIWYRLGAAIAPHAWRTAHQHGKCMNFTDTRSFVLSARLKQQKQKVCRLKCRLHLNIVFLKYLALITIFSLVIWDTISPSNFLARHQHHTDRTASMNDECNSTNAAGFSESVSSSDEHHKPGIHEVHD